MSLKEGKEAMTMKKIMMSLLTLILVIGIGSVVYANTDGFTSFEERLPFMQERHPDLSVDELEERFQSCRYNGGPGNGIGYRINEEDARGQDYGYGHMHRQGKGYGHGPRMMRFNDQTRE